MANTESKNPGNSDCDRLIDLCEAGNLAAAEQQCRSLLNDYPVSGFVHHILGVIANTRQQYQNAIAYYEQAIELDPGYADSYNNLGIVLKQLGRGEEAAEKFKQAVQLDPDYADARNNLAVTLQERGQHQEALQQLSAAISLVPGHPVFRFNLANSQRALGMLEQALASYDRALQLNPNYVQAWNNRGGLLEELQRYRDAGDSYTRALQLRPDYASAYSNRGLMQKQLGSYEGALKDFQKALELESAGSDGGNTEVRFRLNVNLGDILVHLRRYREAVAAYDAALAIEPDKQDVVGFKGNALAALGKLEEGLSLRQQAFGFIAFDVSKGVSIVQG